MAKLFSITYNAGTDELETAYKAFQTRFALKKKVLFTIVYIIVIVLGVDLIIKNPSALPGYIASGLGTGILLMNWIKPVMIRKKLFRTLAELNDETYKAAFYDDRIEIETIIQPGEADGVNTETIAITSSGVYTVEEGSEAAKELEALPPPKNDPPPKTVYKLADTELSFREKDGLMILFVARSNFHTIPLRCLTDEEAEMVRKYFGDKAIG